MTFGAKAEAEALQIPSDSPSSPSTIYGKCRCEYRVSVSSKHRLGSVVTNEWEYHSLPVGVLVGCNGHIRLCRRGLRLGSLLILPSHRYLSPH